MWGASYSNNIFKSPRLIKRNKVNTSIPYNTRNEQRYIITDYTGNRVKHILQEYHEQLYANKSNNIDKMKTPWETQLTKMETKRKSSWIEFII